MSPKKVRTAFLSNLEVHRNRLLQSRWGQLVVRTMSRLEQDGAADMAASLSYYALISVFPLLIGIIVLLSFFFPSEFVQEELFSFFERNLPTSVGLLRENIVSIIRLRGTLGILSVAGLFWSGSALFAGIARVANRAWGIRRYRPFYKRKLRDLLLAVGTGVVFFFSLALTAVLALVPETFLPFGVTLTAIVAEVVVSLPVFVVFLLIHRYIPNTRVTWRHARSGALLAAALFEIIRNLFGLYLARFANFELLYGSIASVIAFLVWIYLSSFALILGLEFSSEYSKMTAESVSRS